MPLTAQGPGGLVTAPLLADREWDELRRAHSSGELELVCRDKGHRVHPRTSRRGLRHFAHYSGVVREGAEETLDHLALKTLCVQIAHQYGWEATAEHPAPDRSWVADVLATKGALRIVFEVQWSQQREADFELRTKRYRDAGLQVVWLERVRKNSFARVRDGDCLRLPFWKDTELGYVDAAHEPMALRDRLVEICSGQLLPGPRTVYVGVFENDCWQCGNPCTVWQPPGSELWAGPDRVESMPSVRAAVSAAVKPSAPTLARLSMRSSRTAGCSYQAFNCPWCSALLGDFYLADDYLEAVANEQVTRVPVVVGDEVVWDTELLEDEWIATQRPPAPRLEPPPESPQTDRQR